MAPTEAEDERFYRDTEAIAFPKLSDEQLALLEPLGSRRKLKQGDYVLKAGQREFPLTVLLEGELEAFETRDGTEQILATAGPRDFLGDVSILHSGNNRLVHRPRWQQVCPASSPSATFVPVRSNAVRLRWVKAAWPSPVSTKH